VAISDPMLERRTRLHLSYRLFAHAVIAARDNGPPARRLARVTSSMLTDVSSWWLLRRASGRPAAGPLMAINSIDSLLWSGVGEDPVDARGAALVPASAALVAGYRLATDTPSSLTGRLAEVAGSLAPVLVMASVRRRRGRRAGWGLVLWPAAGAAFGFGIGRYRRAETARRARAAKDLTQDLQATAAAVAMADHADEGTWEQCSRLEYDLLAVSALDLEVGRRWQEISVSKPLPQPAGFVRFSDVVPSYVGDPNPLVHPAHVEALTAATGGQSCQIGECLGLTRPGEELQLMVEGDVVVIPSVYHRAGSDLADRILDPPTLALLWGGFLVSQDLFSLGVSRPRALLAAGAQWFAAFRRVARRQRPQQTMRDAWVAAAIAQIAGFGSNGRAPDGSPALAFSGTPYPFHLFIGYWSRLLRGSERRTAMFGSAILAGALLVRAASITPHGAARLAWWWRVPILDNLGWWAMCTATVFGLDGDLEDEQRAQDDWRDVAADEAYERAYDDAWSDARSRLVARVELLREARRNLHAQLSAHTRSAIDAHITEVDQWLTLS